MNFLALKNKVVERLRERPTPRHWSLSEISDAINRGCRKFANEARIKETLIALAPASNDGEFFLPPRTMSKSGVYWKGYQLSQVDSQYLDNLNKGDVSPMVSGANNEPASDWRTHTADDPHSWLIEDGLVRLYPKPNSLTALFKNVISSSLGMNKATGVLLAGVLTIPAGATLPTDKDMIEVYLNGVYQNQDQWSVSGQNIVMVGGLVVDADFEIVWLAGISLAKVFTLSLTTGTQIITLPESYLYMTSYVAVKINGISQASNTFNKTSAYTVTLSAPLIVDSSVEIRVYEYDITPENIDLTSFDVKMKCVRMPVDMVADTDLPDLPIYMEDYHDAFWLWALVECFSREGQEKDMGMAQFYSALYTEKLKEYKQAFNAPISITPRDNWRI